MRVIFLVAFILATPVAAQEINLSASTSEQIDALIISAVASIEGNGSEIASAIDEKLLGGNQFERQRARQKIVGFAESAKTSFNRETLVSFDLPVGLGNYDFETWYYSFCMPAMFYANGFDLQSSPNLLIVLSPENAPPEERGRDNICSPKGLDVAIADRDLLYPLSNAPSTEAQSRWAKVYMPPDLAEQLLSDARGGTARLSGKCRLQEGSWGEAYGVKRRSGVDCWISEGAIKAGATKVDLVPYFSRQIVFPEDGDYQLRRGDWVFFVIDNGYCYHFETADKPDGLNVEFDFWLENLRHPQNGKWMAAFTPSIEWATLRMKFIRRGETYKGRACK